MSDSTARSEAEKITMNCNEPFFPRVEDFCNAVDVLYKEWRNRPSQEATTDFDEWKVAQIMFLRASNAGWLEERNRAVEENARLQAEVERLTRERDEAFRGNLESGNIQVHGLTMREILELKHSAEAKLSGEKWVSVEERLPDDETWVIVCITHDHWTDVTPCYIENGKWKSEFLVTHWRPLPLPPTEGKDK